MKRLFNITILSCIIFLTINFSSLYAAGTQRGYAIKGAGAVSCERYITAVNKKSTEYIAFSGWIDGYNTSFNQFQPETFDIAPWQSTLLLTQALFRHCKKNPDIRFFKALTTMLQALHVKRLKKISKVVKIVSNEGVLLLYKDIVKQVQTAVNKHNNSNIKVDGQFSSETEEGLRQFQLENKIPITGVPDQMTLQMLFQ